MRVRPPFKIHGGKYYLSDWVISHFPKKYKEMRYVEPFCGGASVFLNKEGSRNVINDIDFGVYSILTSIKQDVDRFIEALNKVEYTKETFLGVSKIEPYSQFEFSVGEFILRRMSRGGMKKAFAWSDRLRGGKPGDVNAWETAIKLLPEISKRLQSCDILNLNAMYVIQMFNTKDTLLYCDPPYLKSTRVSKNVYGHEMSENDHIHLSSLLNNFKGKALISGYDSELYRELYKGWRMVKKDIANHSSQKKTKERKTECLWINYEN